MVTANASAAHADRLPQLFDECQRSYGCHRKNAVLFRKLLNASSTTSSSSSSLSATATPPPTALFFDLLKRVLAVKKREPAVERIVRFLVTAVAYLQQPAKTGSATPASDGPNVVESRFTEDLLRFLLRGTGVDDKSVRLRSCQMLALCIDSIEEME